MEDSQILEHSCDALTEVVKPRHTKRKIGLVLFRGFSLMLVGTLAEVFRLANASHDTRADRIPPYELQLLSAGDDMVCSASSAFIVTPTCQLEWLADEFHAMFIATGTDYTEVPGDNRTFHGLRTLVEHAAMVFAVGHGMLDENSPPWLHRHVARTLDKSGWLKGLAGATSPVETALALIEFDLGSEIAQSIAERIHHPLRWRFRFLTARRAVFEFSEPIQTSARWLETNASRAITMESAAEAVLMRPQAYLRRFKMETGITPSQYLQHIRIELCCQLLADTSLPVDKIARHCGIGSGAHLSKLFRKHFGRTPTGYRAKIQRVELRD